MKKINKICIDDVTDILNFGDGIKELTYGKEYTIMETYEKKCCCIIKHESIQIHSLFEIL